MAGQAAAATTTNDTTAPAHNDATHSSSSTSQAATTAKLLEDTRPGSSSSTSPTKDQNEKSSGQTDTAAASHGDSIDDSTDAATKANDEIRKEVDTEYRSGDSKKLFGGSTLSAEMEATFGTPELLFGEGTQATDVADAGVKNGNPESRKAEGDKTNPESAADQTGDGKTQAAVADAVSTALSDITSWASASLDKVESVAANALDSMMDVFGAAGDWMFEAGSDQMTGAGAAAVKAPEQIAQINDVTSKDFRDQRKDTMSNFDFDVSTGKGIDMPENAKADGNVEIGGNQYTVFRTPDGQTFLKKGDKVVAEQDKDGSYKLQLTDDSTAKVKISKDGDNYNLDSLERTKDGKLQQKYADGVYYNYNYDAQGNRQSVDAAADLKGPMTQEQLDQKLDAIRKELGPNGVAALRYEQDGQRHRLMLQNHDASTSSLTDVDAHRARIFHNGQEYRLNENDQLGVVSKDGTWKALGTDSGTTDSAEPKPEDPSTKSETSPTADAERIKELIRQAQIRAQGDGKTDVDGVKLETNENGDAVITRVDTQTGEKISEISVPKSEDQPMTVTNDRTGEVATIDGAALQLNNSNGDQLFNFDPATGFQTNDFALDQNGLFDFNSGLNLDPNGNLFDMDGNFISGGGDLGEDYFDYGDKFSHLSTAERIANQQVSQETSREVQTLGSLSLSIARSGNPNAIGIARQVAAEALGVADAALSALGNDFYAQIPVYFSQSIAVSALDQANRGERTQTYAMRMGISDTTRLSEFNRVATFSSTAFNPEEYVRFRLKEVA